MPSRFPSSQTFRVVAAAALLCCAGAFAPTALASGIFADGQSAHSEALGGAGVFGLGDGLDALAENPAALSLISRPQWELGGRASWVDGTFHDRANPSAHLSDTGALPTGAIAGSLGPLSAGFGVLPDAGLRARWRYRDTPGGLDGGTTYGTREYFSQLALIRFAFGASYAITPQLSLGAGAGLLYNENRLKAPYTIQTQPQLAGAKTLLDMETRGWGWNGQFGLLWHPRDDFRAGLSYTLPSRLATNGHATSDATAQLARLGLRQVDAFTDFDAEVINHFPQTVSLGLAWQATRRLELMGQVDWIDWSDSFDTLAVRLRHTHSALYRTLLAGSSDLYDDVPLHWRDQWVLRTGAEYHLSPDLALRAGYRYARSPIPAATLTPLTAAIGEHVLTAGLGYRRGPFTCDLAYQWHLPQREHVSQTDLLGGEYRDSTVQISLQTLGLTVGFEF